MLAKKIRLYAYKFLCKHLIRFAPKDIFNKILALEGFEIGEGTIFYSPNTILIDRQRPWMLKIGKYCKITARTTILTHDYSRSVLRRAYGDILGEARMTTIGDNVFIGVNCTILMGAQIGNNVIIGAGSVVGGMIPDNVVVAGNPAKIVRTLEEHYERRKKMQIKEAAIWCNSWKYRYGKFPSERQMGPFFSLFTDREKFDYENDKRLTCNGDNMVEVVADFKKSKPLFESYEVFLKHLQDYDNK